MFRLFAKSELFGFKVNEAVMCHCIMASGARDLCKSYDQARPKSQCVVAQMMFSYWQDSNTPSASCLRAAIHTHTA